MTDAEHEPANATPLSKSGLLFVAALLIFGGARLWRLTSTCLWFDEVFSVHAARHGWAEMIKFVAADIIHPPLFYAVLKVWIAVGGESLLWLRLLPLILSYAAIVPFFYLCRELNLKASQRNLALLLIAVSGFLIKYAQEVRMYSLLLFLSVTSIWLFVRFRRARSSGVAALAALTTVNLLMVYTHYYGWLLVFAQICILIVEHRKRLAFFLVSVTALVIAYVPWLLAVATFREPTGGLSQNIGWISRPHVRDLADYFVLLNKPFMFSQSTLDRADSFLLAWLVLFLVGGALVILIVRRIRARAFTETERVLLALAFVPMLLAAGLSWVLPYSIWGTRHLIISALPFFMLAGVAIVDLRPHWARLTMLLALASVLVLAAAVYLLKPVPYLSWCAWDPMIEAHATKQTQLSGVVYTFEDLVAYHVWFATAGRQSIKVKVVKDMPGMPDDPAFFLPRRFKEVETVPALAIEDQNIWIAYRARRWDENRPPLIQLKALGYRVQETSAAQALGEQIFLVKLTREP